MLNTLRILALYPFLVHFEDLTFNAHILHFFFSFFLFNSWKDFETTAEGEKMPFWKQILIWVAESLWQLLFFYVHICVTARNYSN